MNPTPYGANPELDELYAQLGLIEERETDAIMCGRLDLLPEIRAAQLPLKRQINAMDTCVIYPEAEEEPA